MPYNLLLLPLLGGFVFVTFWNRTKIRASRYEGYRLILYSSLWGAIFSLFSVALLKISWLGFYLNSAMVLLFADISEQYRDFNIVLLSCVVGSTAWIPLNWIFTQEREYAQAVRKFGNRLENFLFEALNNRNLVSITLKSKKVYVGYVIGDINPEIDRSYVTVWPMLSGFREPTNLKLNITNNYAQVYRNLGEESLGSENMVENIKQAYDFRLCIRADEIISVAGYDYDLEGEFYSQSLSNN